MTNISSYNKKEEEKKIREYLDEFFSELKTLAEDDKG